MRSSTALSEAIRGGGRVVAIVNTRARRGRKLAPRLVGMLGARGMRPATFVALDDPTRLPQTITEAIASEPDLIIVAGGDGTISCAATHLAGLDIALGVIPAGTTNNLSRNLGLPLKLPAIVDVLAAAHVVDVDLARAGDHVFANMASLGMSGEVAGRVPHHLKRVLGRTAYPLTALAALPRHQSFEVRLQCGGQTRHLRTHQLNIANGAFHAGRVIAADAAITDQLLVVYAIGGERRLHLATDMVSYALRGHRRRMADEEFLVGPDVLIETDPPLPLDLDGELVGSTPTRITIAEETLRVLVPHDVPVGATRAEHDGDQVHAPEAPDADGGADRL